MAKYQIPPDPRESGETPRPSRFEPEPIPWKWFGLGVVVTAVAIGLAALVARSLLARPPLEAGALPEPTIIRLTAPPSPTPSATSVFPTPTPIPTFTPIPTPDNAEAPPEVTAGFYARVTGTDEIGLTVRGGPSTSNQPLSVANEGVVVLVTGGPEEGDNFFWWQIQLEDGSEGWVAGDYLEPAPAP